MSDENIKWDYASRDFELEAIGWYLTGRLDSQTKLDSRLGAGVNAYEYLRHAVEVPNRRRFLYPEEVRRALDKQFRVQTK